jgi:hypothetical protein
MRECTLERRGSAAPERSPGIFVFLLPVFFVFYGAAAQTDPFRAPFAMPALRLPDIPGRTYDIRSFGALEGGAKNTEAIRSAIGAAAASGGGVVLIPRGRWLTGAIHLESHTGLRLEKGAELLFSQDPADYLPVVFSRHEDTECFKYSAFIYADRKTDIAITGEGVLNGQGTPWWAWKEERKDLEAKLIDMGNRDVPVNQRVFDGADGNGLRPAFFQPMRCKNILVEGVTFLYGAFWTITPTYCENVIIRGVTIETEGEGGHTPNGDGVDPSSCRNVLIEGCTFNTGDDCIAIKAGRDRDGLRVNAPTENVIIRHCRGFNGHGGIVVGSETAGGVSNVFARDCSFSGTDRIVRIKTARGRGGVLQHMWFQDLSGERVRLEGIHLNMLYTGSRLPEQPPGPATPRIRDMHFSRITQSSGQGYALEILGLPEMPVEDVTFDSLSIRSALGIHCADARSIAFSHLDVRPHSGPTVWLEFCSGVKLDAVRVPEGADPFLRVEGQGTGIVVRHTPPAGAKRMLELGRGVLPGAVNIVN